MLMYSRKYLLVIIIIFNSLTISAQQLSGWFFHSHNQKLNDKWSYATDFQLRSSENLRGIKSVLLRGWVSYLLADSRTIGLGYTHFGNWDVEDGHDSYDGENRIFEELQLDNDLLGIEVSNRIRLEQRILNRDIRTQIAQRFRYQLALVIPLEKVKIFQRSTSLILQNEVFLNVQNQDAANAHLFDQNRPYIGWGISLAETTEVEMGYYYKTQIDKIDGMTNSNIAQIKINTTF